MQFSVTTTEKNGLLQACERDTHLGVGTITGSTTLLAEFTNYINEESRRVWHTIFTAYGGWQYDDANQTDLPAATDTLTANQTTYALPTSTLTVRGIEVKNQGGVWTALTPVTEEQIRDYLSMGQFQNTPSQPMYYQLVGTTVRLFPAANYTQVSSFKVFLDRGSVAFVTTDTTKEAGFASEYHDVLHMGASLKWLKNSRPGDGTTAQLQNDYTVRNEEMRRYYSMRWKDMFPPRIKVYDQLREAM